MTDNVAARDISLRPLAEDDIAALFEIQFDEAAQHRAAFTDAGTACERPIHARVVEDPGSVRVLERNGFVPGRQATVTELIFKLAD